jgi:multiple sugar transport system substrate-binding protein
MKRNLVLLLVLVLVIGASVCYGANEPLTIEFWNGHTGPDGEVMKKLAKVYEEAHPNTKINIISMAWDQVFTKAELAIKQGSGPDLVTIPADRVPENIGKVLKPVNDLVKGNFNAKNFDQSLWNLTFYNKKQYGVPLDTHPYVIYYRKDIFAKNGIKVPSDAPLSKSEFLAIAKKLTDKKAGVYGFAFKSLGVHAWWDTWSFFLQAGGTLWDKSGKNPRLDSKAMVNAVSFLKSLQGVVATDQLTDWQTAYSMFVTGNTAMVMQGSWLVPGLNKAGVSYGVMMLPKVFDNYAAFANMHMFGFTRVNEKRTQAALEFVKWVETKNNAYEWGKGSGNVPAQLEARAEYAKDPIMKPIARTAEMNKKQLYMSPYVKQNATVIYKYLVPTMEAIYKDKNINIKKMLTEMNKQVKAVLAN